ncbi:hypothetical protein AUP68_16780 [Ilyonectria robusta]
MVSTQASIHQARERLQALLPTITRLREATGAASVTFGVIHNGQVVLQAADGWRDAVKKAPADVDTAYVIGSTMKAMMASCCGMLVHEGKMSWNDKLSDHLPFHTLSDPVVGHRATVHDALSHTTGLAQLDLSWYGASGKSLVDPRDLLHVVAHLPVSAEFRCEWSYCNYMYVIMARIIDKVGGCKDWPSFLTQRLLGPLEMRRSRLSRHDFTDDNVAEPHYVKDDGTPGALPRPDLSADTLMGPAGCLWSTVPDMLTWVQAVLTSIDIRHAAQGDAETAGVLKEMGTITAHQTQLAHHGLSENTYGYSWARLSMPPPPMYGFMSTNGANERPILGQDSPRRLMLYHGGQVTGYLTTLCIFPETQSAIIVLSNSQALGDASDWTARAIMQELFQLRPAFDLVGMAEAKAKESLGIYRRLADDYRNHNSPERSTANLTDKFGLYRNKGLKLYLEIRPTSRKDKAGEFLLNGMQTQLHYLEHFGESTFGFLPGSREEQESGCMVDYVIYEQFLLTFKPDKDGRFRSLEWVMQPGLEAIIFMRDR